VPRLTLEGLEKRYGELLVVAQVSLAIADGEFVSLLGPSGCGKTTVLRMVAGLIEPSAGRILVDERDITHEPPHRRRIGLVFQSYALFPHLTVFENVAFGLRRQGIAGRELTQRVEQALAAVRLAGLGTRHPRQLSGGQQQRVAVARSIAPRPSILLFDEPLSNLDAALRDEMQIELKRLQREVGITTLFVTHDQTEALSMSDRVCVLSDGRVQQFGTPEEIYHRPASGFVARFIGRPNRLQGRIESLDGGLATVLLGAPRAGPVARPAPRGGSSKVAEPHVLEGGGLRLRAAAPQGLAAGAAVDVVLRQEDLRFVRDGSGHAARVALRSFVGARVQYVLALPGGLEVVAEAPTNGPDAQHAVGDAVQVGVDPAHVYLSTPVAEPGAAASRRVSP